MVETVSSGKDWNTSSMRIVEFPKLIGQSTTAVLLFGFAGEGTSTAAFTDGKNIDHTVVIVPLSFQFKVYT